MVHSPYRFIAGVFACIALLTVRAQQIAPSMVWEQLYDDSACDIYTIVEAEDGGYVLGGRIYDGAGPNGVWRDDCILMKIGANGEIHWEKKYGGTGWEAVRSLRQTIDGGYIFAGNSTSAPSGNKESPHFGAEDAWVVKVNAEGTKQWEESFGTSGEDAAYSIREASDGGYLLAGRSGGNYWSMKINAEGEKEQQVSLGEGIESLAVKVIHTADSGYALAGSSLLNPGPYGRFDGWLMKVNAEGKKEWEQFFGGTEQEIFLSIALSTDGGFILGGRSDSPQSGNKESPYFGGFYDYWLVRVDALGNKQWDRSYGTARSSVEEVRVARETIDEGFVFGGYFGGESKVVKVDAHGKQEWEQYLGGNSGIQHIVEIDELQQTKDGGYILGGSFDYPTAAPRSFGCVWGAWAAKFETVLSRGGDVVTWPAGAGVVLESVDDLNGKWEADQSGVRTIGGANTITFTPTGESRYYRLRGTGGSAASISFGTLLSWPVSIDHVLEFSSNNGAEWTAFAGEQGTIGEAHYAIIPQGMKEHDFRTRKVN